MRSISEVENQPHKLEVVGSSPSSAPKLNKGKYMAKLVRVLIEQTGVETVVSQKYYDKYSREGIRYLGDAGGTKEDPFTKMSYKQLKDAATLKGIDYPGNVSAKGLKVLLREEREE